MQKSIKNINAVLVYTALLFCTQATASESDSSITIPNLYGITLCNSEPSIVVSSMDWYKTIKVYNIETNVLVLRENVRSVAKHQTSQLVFINYRDWGCGEYIIKLQNGLKRRYIRLFVEPSSATLSE